MAQSRVNKRQLAALKALAREEAELMAGWGDADASIAFAEPTPLVRVGRGVARPVQTKVKPRGVAPKRVATPEGPAEESGDEEPNMAEERIMVKGKSPQSRDWCFVIYAGGLEKAGWEGDREARMTEWGKAIVGICEDEGKVRYLIAQLEKCPKTGEPHWQGYVEFKRSQRRSSVQKLLHMGPSDCDPRRKSRGQARNYCHKKRTALGPFVEYGEWSEKKGKQGERTDLNDLYTMVKEGKSVKAIVREMGDAGEALSEHQMRAVERYKRYEGDKLSEGRDWVPEVWWIYGPTGAGKDEFALSLCKKWEQQGLRAFTGIETAQWWDGYSDHDVVWIQDVRPNFATYDKWLRYLDSKPMRIPVKGSMTPLMARKWIFTCPTDPMALWGAAFGDQRDTGNLAQLDRRITNVVHIPGAGEEPIVKRARQLPAARPSDRGEAMVNKVLAICAAGVEDSTQWETSVSAEEEGLYALDRRLAKGKLREV